MLALCVGMYRACSTWQYGVVGTILEQHRAGRRLGFVEGIYLDEKVDAACWATDWAVLKAHDAHDRFGELLAAGRAIGFYAARDLRDVVFSYMHKTGADFDALMERGFVDLCLHNDRFWREQPGVLVQNYDDLIADPAAGVRQIADHLGVMLQPGQAEAVAESLSWEANRRKIESMSARLVEQGTSLSAEDQSKFDPVSLLHWNHIRPSRLEHGTPRQRRLIERVGRSWLIEHGYEVPAEPEPGSPEDFEPVMRTSYAPGGVDIRLDRLFRGTKATAVDFDSALPRVANASYHLYLRGWRSVNIGTTTAARGRFVVERPNDLNLACQLDRIDGTEVLARLLNSGRIAPPDLVIFNPAADVGAILDAIAQTNWRPRVYVIDQAGHDPAWGARLGAAGYRVVPDTDGPQVYLRVDLSRLLPTLAEPLGPDDHYQESEWGIEIPLPVARRSEPASLPVVEPNNEHGRSPGELLDVIQRERDMFQAERDAWQRERDAWQRERDERQRERDDRQRERDDRQRERDAVHAEKSTGRNQRNDRLTQPDLATRVHQETLADRDRWAEGAGAARHGARVATTRNREVQGRVADIQCQVVEVDARLTGEGDQAGTGALGRTGIARVHQGPRQQARGFGRLRVLFGLGGQSASTTPAQPESPQRSLPGISQHRADGPHRN